MSNEKYYPNGIKRKPQTVDTKEAAEEEIEARQRGKDHRSAGCWFDGFTREQLEAMLAGKFVIIDTLEAHVAYSMVSDSDQ